MILVLPVGTIEMIPLGDRAITMTLSGNAGTESWGAAAAIAVLLSESQQDWMLDIVPAYETVTVVYDPGKLVRSEEGFPYETAVRLISRMLGNSDIRMKALASSVREIPICYGGDYGPDLEEAGKRAGLTVPEFIRLHSSAEYTVAMIGFMPGFPYMAGLPPQLAQPRKSVPRTAVPAGSVGIAGSQTGIYPLTVPGGWQIIGRTNVRLFDPDRDDAVLLRAGDRVRFVPVEPEMLLTGRERLL
ncbi:5-oxoprolinase subunit PxpB [Paenibacillus tarimensis]